MKRITVVCIVFIIAFPLYAVDVVPDIVSRAKTLIGTPYRYGGTTPAGFDCSGFITYLFKKYVPGLPRISRDMARYGRTVMHSNLEPGDLVFFATGKSRTVITHVALYIGKDTIIHAVSGGPETGVIITNLNTRYWKKRYRKAVRVLSGIETTSKTVLPSSGEKREKDQKKFAVKKEAPSVSSSPWNTFDGVLEGDFNLYQQKEQNAFDAWKKTNE